jgi:acetylglutamate kinase
MKLLVKLGGALLDSAPSRAAQAAQIARAAAAGHRVVVVHGGGKQMTRFLDQRGVKSQFVEGLRVTTAEVLDAVIKVVAGTVNRELVAALGAAGVRAAGLCGVDSGITTAVQMRPELGAVGRPVSSDPRLLDLLTGAGYVPVVACVAGDSQGNIYNVNADQMAVAVAAALGVDRLIFLTDVEGVRGADGATLARLTAAGARELIGAGVATGGMQAKLNAACTALAGGAGEVVIAPGARERVLDHLLAGEPIGTAMSQ